MKTVQCKSIFYTTRLWKMFNEESLGGFHIVTFIPIWLVNPHFKTVVYELDSLESGPSRLRFSFFVSQRIAGEHQVPP